MENILCFLLGHIIINIDYDHFEADCKRCDKRLKVCYDMCYGGTYVTGEK